MKKKNRSQMWPMEYILGGILTIAVIVLLSYGLRTEDEVAVAPLTAGQESTQSGAHDNSRLVTVEPDQGRPTIIETVSVPAETTPVPAEEIPAVEVAEAADPEPVSFADAELLYQAGDFEAAAESFAAYANENPDNPWGHYMLGLSQYRSGRLDEAEAALRAAADIEPDQVKTWINLSRVLMAAGAGEPALAAAERGVALDPLSGSAARVLGRALHNLDLAENALAAYSGAITLNPRDAWALNNLGLILIEQERFVEALSPLALAASIDESVAIFQNNLGVALETSGFPAAASLAYLRALEADPSYAKAEVNLARAELEEAEAVSPSLASLSADLELRLVAGAEPWAASADGYEEEAPLMEAEAAPTAAPALSPTIEELSRVAESATGL